tara:strand:+ start:4653 stop:5339 length:687 start_codon:yes stop_codon:yes gene_type:complete
MFKEEIYLHSGLLERLKENKQLKLFNTQIFVKDPLPEGIDLENVLRRIKRVVPDFLFYEIDVIYIGQFDELVQKQVNAMYKDGAFYVTNAQSSEEDMMDDIIHELAHAIETTYPTEIYSDGAIESEFLAKRLRLAGILKREKYDITGLNLTNLDYSYELDMFLYKDIGYAKLRNLTGGIFVTAYSPTSLREYFAEGFEYYYLNDREYLYKCCPKLFNIIKNIDSMGDK